MSVLDHAFGFPMNTEEQAARPLAGGIMRGYQCGVLWGSVLAAGAQAFRLLGPGAQSETGAIIAAQKVLGSFCARTGNRMNCREISNISCFKDKKQNIRYVLAGGAATCLRIIAAYPPEAMIAIATALSEVPVKIPSPPVSCSSMLAQKLGVSANYATMVAGLAGGIGLSGGACGALGATIRLTCIKELQAQTPQKIMVSKIDEIIERFSNYTGSTFECTKIVGRQFTDVNDHASYLRSGGCQEIIAQLASK